MIPLLVPVGLGLIGGYLTKESKHQVFAEGGGIMSEWAVTITNNNGETYDWVGFAESEDDAVYKAEQEAGFESVETGVNQLTDEFGNKIKYAKGGKVRNYSYLPNDKISYLLTDDGNVITNKDILDGAYIRGKKKLK